MTDLLPCPFCGGDNISGHAREFDSHYRYFIRCVYCDFEMSEADQMRVSAEVSAERKWNTRATDPDTVTIKRRELLKIQGCLEYLEGWQSKDGAHTVPEVASDALKILKTALGEKK